MAKRFITTELFKDAWYMDLPNKYKLFWIFLITDCDHAGVWQVNYKTASFYVGEHLEPGECERFFKDRIIKIEDGKYWFVPKFIDFQYGRELNYNNRAVRSVIEVLKKYNLFKYLPKTKIIEGASKELASTLQGLKDKDKDKDKDEDKEKESDFDYKTSFEIFRKSYPGIKRGLQTELDDFIKKFPKTYKELIPLLLPSLTKQIELRKHKAESKLFVPEWKHLKTWLNQKCWEEEIQSKQSQITSAGKVEPYSINQFKINQSNSKG